MIFKVGGILRWPPHKMIVKVLEYYSHSSLMSCQVLVPGESHFKIGKVTTFHCIVQWEVANGIERAVMRLK